MATVAHTLLLCLGKQLFKNVSGARWVVNQEENGLLVRFPGKDTTRGINHIELRLNEWGSFFVSFGRRHWWDRELDPAREIFFAFGIYADELQDLITRKTGLAL